MQKEKIVLWGACSRTDKVIKSIDNNLYEILAIVDNDIQKTGGTFHGIPIKETGYLDNIHFDKLILCLGEKGTLNVKEQLHGKGYNIETMNYFIKKQLEDIYKNSDDKEIKDIMYYLKKHDLDVFNYVYTDKYKELKAECEYDTSCKLFYILHNGKKMYMKRSLDTKEKSIEYYRYICMEQDELSPDRYLVDGYNVEKGMCVMDIGAAEGNFSLDVVDKARKIYIAECDPEWLEALGYTFKDYPDKVEIINKYVSDHVSDHTTTIDSILSGKVINYIKMDVEGSETEVLDGASVTLKSNHNLICAVCAYHRHGDEKKISDKLHEYGMFVEPSSGYMCFLCDVNTYINPEFRRGIIRGKYN